MLLESMGKDMTKVRLTPFPVLQHGLPLLPLPYCKIVVPDPSLSYTPLPLPCFTDVSVYVGMVCVCVSEAQALSDVDNTVEEDFTDVLSTDQGTEGIVCPSVCLSACL